MPLVGLRFDDLLAGEPRVAEPHVGENDLRLEGLIKLTSRTGVVVEVPVKTTLPGAMSPAFLSLAQQQLEAVLENLVLTPAKVAFISYLEEVKATRKVEAEKIMQTRAAEMEKQSEALRAQLNGKATQRHDARPN